jgi:hypothetical protein
MKQSELSLSEKCGVERRVLRIGGQLKVELMPTLEFSVLLLEKVPFYLHLGADGLFPLGVEDPPLLSTKVGYLVKKTMILWRLMFLEVYFAHVKRAGFLL